MTAGREDGAAGAHGELRTSAAERDQAISLLQAAFVQGRLTKDEFDLRVGQVFASRTYADLGALTADIPDGVADVVAAAEQPAELEPRPRRTLSVKTAARVGAVGAIPSMASAAVAMTQTSGAPAVVGVLVVGLTGLLVTVLLTVLLVAGSWVARRSQRDPAQRPPSGRSGLASRRPTAARALPPARRRPPRVAEVAACLG